MRPGRQLCGAVDAGGRIVAVDETSLHAPVATEPSNVGYLRTLSVEPILAGGKPDRTGPDR